MLYINRKSDPFGDQLSAHVAKPQHDIPHETSYEVPHEIHESVKLSSDWINLIEHNEGANHISDELRKNQMLHGDGAMPMHHEKADTPTHHISDSHHLMKRSSTLQRKHKSHKDNHKRKQVTHSNKTLHAIKKRVLMDHYDEIQVEEKGKVWYKFFCFISKVMFTDS